MKQIKSVHYTSHREVWLLLPWYVNRSLGGDDKQLVENHLKVCLPCRGELTNQRGLLTKVCETTPIQIAGKAAFSNLQKRMGGFIRIGGWGMKYHWSETVLKPKAQSANDAREIELILQTAGGDTKAFESLYSLYYGRLFRFICRVKRGRLGDI